MVLFDNVTFDEMFVAKHLVEARDGTPMLEVLARTYQRSSGTGTTLRTP